MSGRGLDCAVIGAGNMGAPISARLLETGHRVTVCDRDDARLSALAAQGATTTRLVQDCAGAQVILVLVATEAQLRSVAAELAHGQTGSGLVAVMCTVPAAAIIEVAEVLAAVGLNVVDAPISGGVDRARSGRLTIMAGGDPKDIEVLGPVFGDLATHIFTCGGLGAGQAVKIVNNILCHANTVLAAEAFRLGQTLGLIQADMAQVMEVSTGRNYLTSDPKRIQADFSHHTSDRNVFDGLLAILQKDMAIAADLSASAAAYPMINGVARLIGSLGDETYETWQAVSHGDED